MSPLWRIPISCTLRFFWIFYIHIFPKWLWITLRMRYVRNKLAFTLTWTMLTTGETVTLNCSTLLLTHYLNYHRTSWRPVNIDFKLIQFLFLIPLPPQLVLVNTSNHHLVSYYTLVNAFSNLFSNIFNQQWVNIVKLNKTHINV